MKLDDFLADTLEDGRFSRAERKALRLHLAEHPSDRDRVDDWCVRAMQIAMSAVDQQRCRDLVAWLHEVNKVLRKSAATRNERVSEAFFSPGEEPRRRIVSLIRNARSSIDCCVFTITDNQIVDVLLETQARGVELRIISDDDKAMDRGSDIERMVARGVPIKLDRTSAHMHHKFALFDGVMLLTGSYNWTRSAARENEENIIVTNDEHLVYAFKRQFETLWAALPLER